MPSSGNIRTFCLSLILLLQLSVILGQEKTFNRETNAGIYVNGGWNIPVRLTTKYITEETSPWHGYQSWSAGLFFSFMTSDFYRLEIATQYSWHKIGFELSPPIYDIKKVYSETFELFSIPISLKRYLNYDFFISAGTVVDFSFKGKPKWSDPQSGFGLTLGAGKEFRRRNLVVDITPEVELHSIVPFVSEDNQQRLLVCGLRIGISYKPEPGLKHNDDKKQEEIVIPEP